jgi:gamma-tubulin complex component 5
MDTQQTWTDFHFLNTALTNTIQGSFSHGRGEWVHLPLVRLSYRSAISTTPTSRSVSTIEGLRMEYAAPFPLTYILTPDTFVIYNKVFVFLLQIRRGKAGLERLLVRTQDTATQDELKFIFALRGRFSWFIKYVLNSSCIAFIEWPPAPSSTS